MRGAIGQADFKRLLRKEGPEAEFRFVNPPFNFNAPGVAEYPPEVTGSFLLRSLCRRVGWKSLEGRRLLDFGCGVRFARTIANLGLDIALYAGVDVNSEAISWLRSQVRGPRFRFEHLDMRNPMYRPDGSRPADGDMLQRMALTDFDAACMFSVITHQKPEDAALIFSMLYRCVKPGGAMYFTAFADELVPEYTEGDPDHPVHMSTYNPNYLIELVRKSGWMVEGIYPPSLLQQSAFACRKPPRK